MFPITNKFKKVIVSSQRRLGSRDVTGPQPSLGRQFFNAPRYRFSSRIARMCFLLAPFLLASTSLSATPGAAPSSPKKQVEIGAISRATGHQFREGLTAGFTADRSTSPSLKGNEHGLIGSVEEGAFPPDLWDGFLSSDFERMMGGLAPRTNWPTTLPLIRRLLLTDAPWPEGNRFLDLRLEKMIEFSASDAAARLYTHIAPENPNARLVASGAYALILSKQPSVACVEVQVNRNVLEPSDKYIPKRHDLLPFCAGFMARSPNSDDTPASNVAAAPLLYGPFQTTPDHIFAAKSPILTAATIESFLPLGPIAIAARPYVPGITLAAPLVLDLPKDLNPEAAGVLANQGDLPFPLRLKLYAESGDITPPTPPAQSVSDPIKNNDLWSRAAALYTAQRTDHALSTGERLSALLGILPDLPPKIQVLFAPTLEKIPDHQTLSDTSLRQVLAILLMTDSNRVAFWSKRLLATLPTPRKHDPEATALLLLATMRGDLKDDIQLPFDFSQAKAGKNHNLIKIVKIFTDLLDKPPVFIDTPPVVYEKKTDLTRRYDYVMNGQTLRRHLSEGTEKGHIGRVVLASLLLLQAQEPKDLDPDVLAAVLDGFVAVGLKEEARQIATTVLLGVTSTGE